MLFPKYIRILSPLLSIASSAIAIANFILNYTKEYNNTIKDFFLGLSPMLSIITFITLQTAIGLSLEFTYKFIYRVNHSIVRVVMVIVTILISSSTSIYNLSWIFNRKPVLEVLNSPKFWTLAIIANFIVSIFISRAINSLKSESSEDDEPQIFAFKKLQNSENALRLIFIICFSLHGLLMVAFFIQDNW